MNENAIKTQWTERIRCPECGKPQNATVTYEYWPWPSYVHECQCGYWITESEWEKVDD